ncbi:2-isopropylmalate synthase [Proteus mirabilis]|uniref:2-isopropylmalate synthase n=1 Tax=Proteus mirabilis TaxID=584 RepID=A0A379GEL9_PROMI|nr:2-isopropylmalate synthase [Proteus mirabilis]
MILTLPQSPLNIAEAFRIHVFLATSALHAEHKLKKSFDDIIEMGTRSIKRARRYTDDV